MPMLLKIKKTGKGYGRAYRRHIPQDNHLCRPALLFGHTSTDYHARSDRQMVCHPACICRNTDCIYLFALFCLSQHKSSFLVYTQKIRIYHTGTCTADAHYRTGDAFPPAGKHQLQTPAGISPPSPFPNCVVFFLIISGFGLAIEVIFELFRQMLARQEMEAEKTVPNWPCTRRK